MIQQIDADSAVKLQKRRFESGGDANQRNHRANTERDRRDRQNGTVKMKMTNWRMMTGVSRLFWCMILVCTTVSTAHSAGMMAG
jgi:hypothetical protein